ncbi:Cysteine protease ATG4B, partial [Galemys pyrenaicus]
QLPRRLQALGVRWAGSSVAVGTVRQEPTEPLVPTATLTYDTLRFAEFEDFPETAEPVWILGRKYSVFTEKDEILSDVASRLWFTYRKNFPAIGGTGPTSDTGWGCMLRCGQMIFAQALVCRHLGRDWRWARRKRQPDSYLGVLSAFIDRKDSCYSIHQIAQMGVGEGKSVGQWYGPNTVAQVLKYVPAAHGPGVLARGLHTRGAGLSSSPGLGGLLSAAAAEVSSQRLGPATSGPGASRRSWLPASPPPLMPSVATGPAHYASAQLCMRRAHGLCCSARKLAVFDTWSALAVHIAMDNTVVMDDIRRLCRSSLASAGAAAGPSDASRHCNGCPAGPEADRPAPWRPLVLLIPLRLGLTDINEAYVETLKRCFTLPQSLGVIGGKPNSAHYFIGYVGEELIYLDPHTTQPAVDAVDGGCIPDESFHCQHPPSRMGIAELDPSIAVGFFCETEDDFADWCRQVRELSQLGGALPMFELVEQQPTHLAGPDALNLSVGESRAPWPQAGVWLP